MPKYSPLKLRPWGHLKGDAPTVSEEKSLAGALERIGQTADGKILANWLRRYALEAVPPVDSSVGALRDYEAARRIAAPLVKSLERKTHERKPAAIDAGPGAGD